MTVDSNSYGPYGPTFQIIPGVQSYDWGKKADEGSLVAQFAEATEELHFKKKGDQPYAELWMGTHNTLPSKVIPPPHSSSSEDTSKYTTLSSHIASYPSLVGKHVHQHFFPSQSNSNEDVKSNGKESSTKADIPFLFKVLSIGKALSIQAHPDKALAKKLHAEKPDMYKDDNHKPEMAIALTNFKGFCGFRPIQEIATFLSTVPEFREIVKPSDELTSRLDKMSQDIRKNSTVDEKEKKSLLRQVFSQLMEAKEADVAKAVNAISQRYQDSKKIEVDDKLAQLVCTLNKQYPADVGVFCAFVLNVTELQAGESMFLMANEPHAYLEGEIIECMAASDNVVRAGLTPKARDVQVLVDMLTYSDEPSHQKLMKAQKFLPDGKSENYQEYQDKDTSKQVPTLLYDPPIEEFSVLMTKLSKGQPSELQRSLQGPSILIVTSGTGTLTSIPSSDSGAEERTFQLSKPGQVFFVGAQTKLRLQADKGDLVVFRSFVEVS